MVKTRSGRSDRDAEDLGDLGRFTTLVVAQGEQRSLLWGKSSEASLELVTVGDAQEVVVGGRDVARQGA
jgi:hypothetical protein